MNEITGITETMSYLLECTIRMSVVLTIALLAVRLLRARSAALRHWILVIAMCASAILPFLTPLMPHWNPVPAITAGEIAPPAVSYYRVAPLVPSQPKRTLSPAEIFMAVWVAGTVATLAVLIAGALRLGRIAERSEPVFLGNWVTLSKELSVRYGLRRSTRLLQSNHGSFLVTWGGFNPHVLLPANAADWPADRIRVVLSHELAHVRRWDWPIQMMTELLRAAYWFNPLFWIASNRLKRESEQACDDDALNLGIAGADYATHLLELARILKESRRAWSPGLAIARPSTLERRFTAMLNPVLDRRKVTRPAILAIAIAAICITLPLAALQSTAQAAETQTQPPSLSGRLTGSVSDVNGAAVARATIIVSTPDGRTQDIATTTPTGVFGFAGFPAGQYVLQVFATGFGPSRMTNIELVAGKDLKQDIKMDIGFVQAAQAAQSAQNNIQLGQRKEGAAPPFRALPPSLAPPLNLSSVAPKPAEPEADAAASPSTRLIGESTPAITRIRQGGNVMQAHLIPESKTPPAYPPLAKQARIQGIVVLEALIDTEGRVAELHVISGHPLLQQAAIDSVSTWRYTPTLLNGAAVEVVTTITVNFAFAQ